jgi:4-oxalocrotonate tautomerase
MPLVKVDMLAGKTSQEKERIIKGITKAFEDVGVPKDWVQVVINENPPENWGVRGQQVSKIPKK